MIFEDYWCWAKGQLDTLHE